MNNVALWVARGVFLGIGLVLSDAAIAEVRADDYFPPPDSAGGWRTLKEASRIRELAGLELARLQQAFDLTQRATQNGGLLVVRHGYLVFWDPLESTCRHASLSIL